MTPNFLGLPFWLWGIFALGIAGVYIVFVPQAQKVRAATGFRFIIVRWFHSVVWSLLALAAFLMALDSSALGGLAQMMALCAGVVYAIFIVTFIRL